MNGASDSEDHGAWAGGFDGGAQAAGAVVIEIGYFEDATASAANGESAGTLSAGKGGDRRCLSPSNQRGGSEREGDCRDED